MIPFIDEHSVSVSAPRDAVWTALERFVERQLVSGGRDPFRWLLGTEPAPGFGVAERVPGERLVLEGRHRFSRYRLVFGVGDGELRALTYAEFPGPHGFVYRTLVITSRLHVVATRRMLREIAAGVRA